MAESCKPLHGKHLNLASHIHRDNIIGGALSYPPVGKCRSFNGLNMLLLDGESVATPVRPVAS